MTHDPVSDHNLSQRQLIVEVPLRIVIDQKAWRDAYGDDETSEQISSGIREKALDAVAGSHLASEFGASIRTNIEFLLYEDDDFKLYLHRDGDLIAWALDKAPDKPDSTFKSDCHAWLHGTWEPDIDDGQRPLSVERLSYSEGFIHIASWVPDVGVVLMDNPYNRPRSRASARYLGL